MNIGSTFDREVVIWRRDGTDNSLGEPAESFSYIGSEDCSFHVGIERDRRPEAGLLDKPFYVLHVYPSSVIAVEDRLEYDGGYYRVAAVEVPHGKTFQFKRVFVQEWIA